VGVGGQREREQRADLVFDRPGVGAPVAAFEARTFALLVRAHAPGAAALRVGEGVGVVALRTHQGVELADPVLAVFEALETVEDERFAGLTLGPMALVEEEAVTAEALELALDRRGRDSELAGDLAVRRAAEQAVKARQEQLRTLLPVGGVEGL
jgi:hypothetical protein